MTVKELETRRDNLHNYILFKLGEHDYHAVADAAMDLRELELKICILKNNPFGEDTCNADKLRELIR
jgi:hypothetical protein